MTRWKIISVLAACFIIVLSAYMLARAESFSYISTEKLKTELGNPKITILDVRVPQDWNKSQWKIKGAIRESPNHVGQWMNKFSKDQTIVLYCA